MFDIFCDFSIFKIYFVLQILKYFIGENDIALNLGDLHAWINILRHLKELAFLQNSRAAFPNRIPKKGRKNKKEWRAYKKAKRIYLRKVNSAPLNLPIGRPDYAGVITLWSFHLNLNQSDFITNLKSLEYIVS